MIPVGAIVVAVALWNGPSAPIQTAPAQTTEEIVVTGAKLRARRIEKTALAVTPPGDLLHEPLARFSAPVCPGVIGMPDAFASTMVGRIRSIAQRAGIRVARSKACTVNLLVVFMPDGAAAMRNLLHGGPWLFGNMTRADLRDLASAPELSDLAAQPGPVHAWVNTEIRGRDGQATASANGPGIPGTLTTGDAASRLSMPARNDIVGSLVVIDLAAARGLEAEQLADYVAMRGLVRTRPPTMADGVTTILSLFNGRAAAPLEMTRFDRAYLRAVYRSAANVAGVSKLMQVAREMRKGPDDE